MIRSNKSWRGGVLSQPARMFSRKSASALTFAALTLIVLIITSKRLGSWSAFDSPYHPVGTGYGYGQGPQGSGGAPATVPQANATDDEGVPARPLNHDFPPRPNRDPLCDSFPDTSGILLVMKTGASESFGKLPTQLMTVLKCLPDFLIFSDMEQHVAGYRVHDSLETVLDSVRDGNSDFDLYRRQRWCDVDQGNCNKLGDPSSEGWNLDKYKNVHMAEKTYEMKPGYDWYVFVDADTYVLWPNMVQWLGRLKASKNLYLGSVAMVNDFAFGHGGSGYVVSKAAMQNFAGKNPGVGNDYDARARNECCGDYVFALAMKEKANIAVQNVVSHRLTPFVYPIGRLSPNRGRGPGFLGALGPGILAPVDLGHDGAKPNRNYACEIARRFRVPGSSLRTIPRGMQTSG
jgi:hypothetical protein